jgi:hypothetical protein
MSHRYLLVIVISIVLLVFFSLPVVLVVNQACSKSSETECLTMLGVAVAAISGGVIFTEMLFVKAKQKKLEEVQETQSQGAYLSLGWILGRPLSRVILIILLSGLPLIVQGAIGLTIFGFGVGFSLSGLIHGITKRLL